MDVQVGTPLVPTTQLCKVLSLLAWVLFHCDEQRHQSPTHGPSAESFKTVPFVSTGPDSLLPVLLVLLLGNDAVC